MGELGWWYYLDGNYPEAVVLLSVALQQRPGDIKLALPLAWALIEVLRYGDALQTLEGTSPEHGIQPEIAMARAVARWQAQEHDQALLDFGVSLGEQPEWGNSSWVKALYSPLVAQSIQEMQAERERRRQKTRVSAAR
jgi:tetratricopeptide (TPR) repeat protein